MLVAPLSDTPEGRGHRHERGAEIVLEVCDLKHFSTYFPINERSSGIMLEVCDLTQVSIFSITRENGQRGGHFLRIAPTVVPSLVKCAE